MTKHILRSALLGLAAVTCMQAGDVTFSLGGNLNLVGGSLKDQQVGGLGFGLHGDATLRGDYTFRAGLGLNTYPGSKADRKENSLNQVQVYGDTLAKLPVDGLSLVVGLSLNSWKTTAKFDGDSKTAAYSYDNSVKGLKFGARLGVEYAFSKNLSGQVLLQACELGTTSVFVPNGSERVGAEGINPTWLQVGVRYTF